MKKTVLLAACAAVLALGLNGCSKTAPAQVSPTDMATWSNQILVDSTLGVTCFTRDYGNGALMSCVSTSALKTPVDAAKVTPINLLIWSQTILLDDRLGTVCFSRDYGNGGYMGCVPQAGITPTGMTLIRNLLAASKQPATR